MGLASLFYFVATGSRRRRTLLTPLGLAIFVGVLALFVWGAARLDSLLGRRALLAGLPGAALGFALTGVGCALCVVCAALFLRARGTPVPFNPPQDLVSVGPYAHVRNPMLTGVFLLLFGLGFLTHSMSLVLLIAPAFVVANLLELRFVEEPELERRFGTAYSEYRRRVPMFVPRLRTSARAGRVA